MHAADKKIDEMNRLADMTHFPAIVNAGASINIVLTLCATYWLVPRYPKVYEPMVWLATVLALNLAPVVLLRQTIGPATVYRRLGEMDFFRDQHKFSDWVYLAASANMAFWILSGWAIFSIRHDRLTLLTILLVAFLVTFSPVLLRAFKPSTKHS